MIKYVYRFTYNVRYRKLLIILLKISSMVQANYYLHWYMAVLCIYAYICDKYHLYIHVKSCNHYNLLSLLFYEIILFLIYFVDLMYLVLCNSWSKNWMQILIKCCNVWMMR